MKIELSISEPYAPDWGVWEGVRDLAQNVRDAVVMHGCEQEFKYEPATKTLTMRSSGVTIDASKLLLGETSKRGFEEAAGQYGEGLKIAMLALVRAKIDVVLRTGDQSWTPLIERSNRFNGMRVLKIQTARRTFKNEVCVILKGIEPEDWDVYRRRLLFVEPPEESEAIKTARGTMLLAPRYRGKLYAHGIYVCDVVNMRYGYDLHYVKVDRDRKMADSWEIQSETTLVKIAAAKQRRALFRDIYDSAKSGSAVDGNAFSLRWSGDEVANAMLEEWDREHGEGALVAENETQAAELRYLGAKVGIAPNESMRKLIEGKRGTFYANRSRLTNEESDTHPRDTLDGEEVARLETAERLLADVGKTVHATVVTFRGDTVGRIDLSTQEIKIDRKVLRSTARTLSTLVHEVAHRDSEATDGSHEHHAAALSIFEALLAKAYPEIF